MSLKDRISTLDTTLSITERLWTVFSFLAIGGTGVVGAFMARATPLLKGLGAVYWLGIGVGTALCAAMILYLIKASRLKDSYRRINDAFVAPTSGINPLNATFIDQVIKIEDLYFPTDSIHLSKHFRRCKIVGPGALVISGGSYNKCNFFAIGDVIPLPEGTHATGVPVLLRCTVEECDFVQVTLLADQATAAGFATIKGIKVAGWG